MTKRTFAVVLGVLFGIYLMAFAYFSFVMSIVISLKFDINLSFTIIAFPVLGVATIVGACLTKKCIMYTRVIYTLSALCYVSYIVLLFAVQVFSEFSVTMLVFIAFVIISIIATILVFLTKKQPAVLEQNQQAE